MTVYIEDCLIENFVVTLLCLNCCKNLFKQEIKKVNLLLASALGAGLSVLYPLINLNGILLIIFKMACGILIVALAFYKKKILPIFIAFLMFTALYAGLNLLFYYMAYGTLNVTDNFSTYVLLVLLLVCYYLIISSIKLIKKNIGISNFVYEVKILNNGKELKIMAFLDSGNTLLDYDSTPIFIINKKLFNKLYKDMTELDILLKNFKALKEPHYIKSNFASASASMMVFSVDELSIMANQPINFKNAKLGLASANFDKNFNCNMLLNINAFCK